MHEPRDEDHDGLVNCDDPDCQNLDICRDAGRRGGDAGTTPPATTGHIDAGSMKPPADMDGGEIRLPVVDGATDDDDGGTAVPTPDAGPVDAGPPPPTCSPKCSATEQCVDLTCEPVSSTTSQTMSVTVASVAAASSIRSRPATTRLPEPSWGLCCPIDPYVRVIQMHADKPTVVGQTDTVLDDASPMYTSAPTWTVDLAQGDLLVFQVWDDNSELADTELYECKPNLTDFKPGPQRCGDFKGPLYRLLTVTVDLEPK